MTPDECKDVVLIFVLGGIVGLVLAGMVAAWFAMRARRMAWERYEAERDARAGVEPSSPW